MSWLQIIKFSLLDRWSLKESQYWKPRSCDSRGFLFFELGSRPARRRCRGEVKDEAWMFGDPFQHVRVFVSGVVINNDMDSLSLRHPGVDDVEEADELLMAMTFHALAEDLALSFPKISSARIRAMS
jgi:hypothetical protein